MKLKTKQPAHEHDIKSIISRLALPSGYVQDISSFSDRNNLVKSEEGLKICCLQCLKAHVIKKGKEYGLEDDLIEKISSNLDCEAGHEGYYLDNGKLLSI